MLRFTPSAVTRREFLVRSAATAAGTFMSIGLPALSNIKRQGRCHVWLYAIDLVYLDAHENGPTCAQSS